MPRLLVDSDIFCKLSITGLFSEAMLVFGTDVDDCGCLPALQHMLRRGKLRRTYGDACEAMIGQAVRMAVHLRPSAAVLDQLSRSNEIDVGEAQLLAAAAELDCVLLTGDKRALRAVAQIGECVEKLSRRIVTMEAILLALCARLGEDVVRAAVAPFVQVDTMFKTCFSASNREVSAGLRSYFQASTRDVEPLELWKPPEAST